MKILNSNKNDNDIEVYIDGKKERVEIISPESKAWFRIFKREDGRFVAQDTMDAPDSWKFIQSVFLGDYL